MKMAMAVMIVMVAAGWAGAAGAGDAAVPKFLSFQSALHDDGGNPIGDGPVDVSFRITDAEGAVLYEESQSLDAMSGVISAIIGGGLTPQGAPTGGIPEEALRPEGARYLEAEVEGFPPTPPMEITSAPYALYAGEALGVAAGAVGSEAIADGGVEYGDLSSALIERLISEITGGGGAGAIILRDELPALYRQPTAASSIGVRPILTYSAANDLQGALSDLDRAIKRRDERIDAEAAARADIQADISAETAARITADSAEAAARITADSAEAAARAAADAAHAAEEIAQAHPNGLLPASRLAADVATQSELDAEATARQQGDALVLVEVQRIATDVVAPLQQEVSAMLPSAWGTVYDVLNGNEPQFVGGNVQAITIPEPMASPTTHRVSFTSALSGSYYAAIVDSLGEGCDAWVQGKDAQGLTVKTSAPACFFDFIVIGP